MKTQFYIYIFLISLSFNGFCQDPLFDQFNQTRVFLNPSYAGNDTCLHVTSVYRNQWPAMSGNYVTQAIAIDQHLDALHGGLGLAVMHDQIGQNSLQTTRITGMYAYHKILTRKLSMRAALEVSYFQRSLDWSGMTFGDMIDPRRGLIYETQYTPIGGKVQNVDFGAGLILFTTKFHIGFAAHHLNEPNESLVVGLSRLPMKLTVHGGGSITSVISRLRLTPNFRLVHQAEYTLINYGITYSNTGVYCSLYGCNSNITDTYENQKKMGLIGIVGLNLDYLNICYSYNYTLNQVDPSGGGHEISLVLRIQCKKEKSTIKNQPKQKTKSQDLPQQNIKSQDQENNTISNINFSEFNRESVIERIFVVPIENQDCEGNTIDGQEIASLVESLLLGKYDILERRHFEQILDEQRLAATGLLLEETAVELGCNAGSQGILFTEVGCLSEQETISLKLVGCQTSEIYWSCLGIGATPLETVQKVQQELSK